MSASATTLPYARPSTAPAGWVAAGWAARLFVGVIFILAAAGKIEQPAHFADEIRAYGLAPFALTNGMAYILPWAELIVGVLLVLNVWRCEARFLTALMLVVFTAAKVYAEVNHLKIGCGCFSGFLADYTKWLSGPTGIALNVLLLGSVAVDWVSELRTRPTARQPSASAAAS